MKIVNIVLIGCLLFSSPAMSADCVAQPIKKGDVVQCDGYAVSKDQKEDSEINKLLVEKLTQRNELRDKQLEIMEKRVDLYVNQSDVLAKQQASSGLEKIIYFVLGAGLMYGAAQLAK